MRKIVFSFLCLVFLIGFSEQASAQFNRKSIKKSNKRMANYKGRKLGFKNKSYNALGFSVNALNYYGDISPKPQRVSTDISFTKPAIGVSFMHRFGPRYSLIAQFMYGTLRGSDSESAEAADQESGKYRYQRNLSFRNRIKELSVMAYFDLFENDATYLSRAKWTPYAFVGLTGFLHNPQALAPATDLLGAPLAEAGQWVDLRPLGTEGQHSTLNPTDSNNGIKAYSKIQVAIPIGLGARFKLNDVMDLWAEIGFRYTFTDYLDDVSKNYVDLGVLNSPLAKAMSYRSNELPANELPTLQPYVARDTQTYSTIPGYGREHPDNIRGSKDDKDIYMVTTIRLTYIIGATYHKSKFR
jgi:Domain of unknown function (DUF6089)